MAILLLHSKRINSIGGMRPLKLAGFFILKKIKPGLLRQVQFQNILNVKTQLALKLTGQGTILAAKIQIAVTENVRTTLVFR